MYLDKYALWELRRRAQQDALLKELRDYDEILRLTLAQPDVRTPYPPPVIVRLR